MFAPEEEFCVSWNKFHKNLPRDSFKIFFFLNVVLYEIYSKKSKVTNTYVHGLYIWIFDIYRVLSSGYVPGDYIISVNYIHVIELLCYNWRFANFGLEIWSHNWRFFIDVFDACFYCLLMFSVCLFQYWTNCIPFQYVLFTFLS